MRYFLFNFPLLNVRFWPVPVNQSRKANVCFGLLTPCCPLKRTAFMGKSQSLTIQVTQGAVGSITFPALIFCNCLHQQ
jgi:hypothetical protein